jgi:putative ABC transport system permease protein
VVTLRAIDRKVVRDLLEMRGQAVAIAFVILAGVATYVAMTSVMDSLQGTLARYYVDYRFADGFAAVRRAPEARLLPRLRTVPGMGQVQTRVTAGVNLEVPGFDEPVSGLLVSVPEGRQPLLNRLYLRRGRLVRAGETDVVLLNESFADAHELALGDPIVAIVNGRRRTLTVVGIALSPEFLMQLQPGSFFPDPERYGVLWMGRTALAAAYDMEGAFNDLAFTLAPGASEADVLERVDDILAPYGGQGAYGRENQASHFLISEEFRSLEGMATLLPAIFLGVAAFLLNIVVTRLISLQREQIAVLKAFGYRNLDVGLHYLKLVLLIALAGCAAGTVLGMWMGHAMGGLYLEFYRFPALGYVLRPGVVGVAVALTSGAAFLGTLRAVHRAVRLPPAEAMRPAPPARYRRSLVERWGLRRLFDQPTRMILRSLERQPVKALLTVVGIGSSCAILIMGLFWQDSFDEIVHVQYGLVQREDLTVSFVEPTSTAAIHEIASLPGVRIAEPYRTVAARLRHGHRSRVAGIEGVPGDAYLRRLVDAELDPVTLPREGIVLSERLGQILGVRKGDTLVVEVLEGERATRAVPVAALSQQFLGLGAFMDLDAANRLAGAGQAVSGAVILADPSGERAMVDALRARPRVAAISFKDRAIESYYETAAASMLTFTFILSLFAGVISFGVVYNSARIALSERDRELASLRVLGFTRNEVGYILLGELGLLVLLALPVGCALGALTSVAVGGALQTDMYQIPVVLGRRTFAWAVLVVLVAATASALIVRRRVNRLDLVGVLKTRE